MKSKILVTRNNYEILIDEEDYEFLNQFWWKVIKKMKVYKDLQSTHFGRIVRMSRLLLNITDPKIFIDHIKGNYTSKYKGVNWNLKSNKWTARIATDNGRKFLGYFNNEKDAAIAYNKAAEIYHKEFARYNNIEE